MYSEDILPVVVCDPPPEVRGVASRRLSHRRYVRRRDQAEINGGQGNQGWIVRA